MPPDPTTDPDTGGILGLLGRFGSNPAALYGGALSDPATQQQMATRGLLAMAGSFADSAMPTRMPTPLGAVLGHAAAAAGAGQDAVMGARFQEAQSEQARAQAYLTQQRGGVMGQIAAVQQQFDAGAGGGGGGIASAPLPGATPGATAGGTGKPPTGPIDPALLTAAANANNLDPLVAHATMDIESSYGTNTGNPKSPSNTGAFQMAKPDAPGGQNDTYENQVGQGVGALAMARNRLRTLLGREPTNAEIYLAHQQGPDGAAALINNPNTPAGKLTRPINISNNGGQSFVNAPASAFVQHWADEYAKHEVKFGHIAAAQPSAPGQTAAAPPGPGQTAAVGGLLNMPPPGTNAARLNAPLPSIAPPGAQANAGLLGPSPQNIGPVNVGASSLAPPGVAQAPLPPRVPVTPQGGAPPPAAPNLVAGGAGAPPSGLLGPNAGLPGPDTAALALPPAAPRPPAPPPQSLVPSPPATPPVPPIATPPAAPPPARPGIPGAPSPERIALAARLSHLYVAAGLPIPPDVEATSKFGLTTAQAQATALATLPSDIVRAQAGPAERGVQARITYGDEMVNVEGLGWVQRKSLPNFTFAGGGGGAPALPTAGGPGAPAPTGPGATASPAAGAPVVLAPSTTPAQAKLFETNLAQATEQMKPYTAEGLAAPQQKLNAQQIIDLLGKTAMGWGADSKQEAAMIMRGLGVSEDNIKTFTGLVGQPADPTYGAALNKMFLKFSSDAVLRLGTHEAASVMGQFAKTYPSLESDPKAAELMTNALYMEAQWRQDRADAAQTWDANQKQNMGPFGQNYHGLNGFEASFNKTNDPANYWRAALAMSGFSDLAFRDTSKAQQAAIFAHVPPGRRVVGPNGQVGVKPPGVQ